MPASMQQLLQIYTKKLVELYGNYLNQVILYGSYARGDYREDSDVDIMILLDLSDLEIKEYRHQLSALTYDFNMEHDIDIKPIAKSAAHFAYWQEAYPFYNAVQQEGVSLFGAA